jgi:hypothetical protein
MTILNLPFTVHVLEGPNFEKLQDQDAHFQSLLPATFRTKGDNIISPQLNIEFLEQELLVERINRVQDWLWICGRPMPARSIHYQVLLGRNITITENMELHLVWSKDRIFLKPIPLYLLDPDFWSTHLIPSESSTEKTDASRQEHLFGCALGFLFSYTSLIAYQSDFDLAKSYGLLPSTVTWRSWKLLTSQFLPNHSYSSLNPRYWYGELRLSRLNKIYYFKFSPLRGYSKVASHAFYVEILRDNLATLTAALVYLALVLTAMQVGLATEKLGQNGAFQNASYGLTVASILIPLIAVVGVVAGVLVLVVGNWAATKNYERRRFRDMGVELLRIKSSSYIAVDD